MEKSYAIVFNGDGYGQKWHEEAKRRGLSNLRTSPDAYKLLKDDGAIDFLISSGVYKMNEIKSRYNIMVERYNTYRLIEFNTFVSLIDQFVVPVTIEYKKKLIKVIKGYKNAKDENVPGLGGNLKYYTCDFVEAEPTDKNKRKLVKESTEMLCIRENAFELVQDEGDFKIFKNSDKYLGIVFYEESINDFKKAIKKIKGHFNAYVFSLGDDPHEKQFADVKGKVTLCAIPEVILKVYREIFK